MTAQEAPVLMPGARTVTLAAVEPERVVWLWPARIPAGKLSLLEGDPAVGKSTLSDDIAARVSAGAVWPDSAGRAITSDVVIASAEDGLADTIRPRLEAAGADLSRIHALTDVAYWDDERAEVRTRALTLADTNEIEGAIRRHQATLLVVDVLMAYLPSGVDSHRDQDVRSVLAALAGVADRTGAAVLLLRHLNKSSGGNVLYRGGGSIGIIGAARAAMVAATDPDDESRRVVAMTKSNLAAMPPALSYRLVDSPEHGCARVEWLGNSAHNASDLLGHREDADERDERDEITQWLVDYLRAGGGQAAANDVTNAAKKALGVDVRRLRRIAARAGITTRKGGFDGGWTWMLPEGDSQPRQGAQEDGSQSADPFAASVSPSPPGCSDCGHPMRVVEPGQTTHPTCRPSAIVA